MRRLELLSPAKNEMAARAAILNGADAVYIGAPGFGARRAASNPVAAIERVAELAHRYYARVFVTLNTVLYDDEWPRARQLVRDVYNAGADALIVQDMALLQLDLPPIALHASTQMHNYDLERIKFLDRLGFRRIVLARELTLDQVRAIRREVSAELEYFVHGALCVSLSGQCYLSHYLTGRSANRGECAQPCRMRWNLADSTGKVLAREKYLLSLKDLNLSGHLPELIEAGVDSFKIEGRLKEPSYTANVTRYYAALLDRYIEQREGYSRASSGTVTASFEPDLERSFNRGFTGYFLSGRVQGLVNADTPKATGKRVAKVVKAEGNRLTVESLEPVHNADGLCYFAGGELKGIQINRAEGNILWSNERVVAAPGTWLYRNHDHAFENHLEKRESRREIRVEIEIRSEERHLLFTATDEDNVTASIRTEESFDPAEKEELPDQICRQTRKSGGTGFLCTRVTYHGEALFLPTSLVNQYRRRLLQELEHNRAQARVRWTRHPVSPGIPFPGVAEWRLNITNALAARFYRDHGVEHPPLGFEASDDHHGKAVMHCRYCILFEMGACLKQKQAPPVKLPLYLYNHLGRFLLEIDCTTCFTRVVTLEKGV
jgi:putative protease